MDDKTTLFGSPTPQPQPGAPAASVPTGDDPAPFCLPGPGPGHGSGHSVIGTTSAVSSQVSPAAPSTLSVTPAKRSQPDAPASEVKIKCSSCKNVLPESVFAYKKSMGTVEHCKQCDGCRKKKRAAEKARKDKKKQEQAQEGAQQQQKQHQGEEGRPEQNQAEDAKRRQEEEHQKYQLKMRDEQRRQLEQIQQQHQGEQGRPEQNQAEDAKRRQEEEHQKYQLKMQDEQRRQLEQIQQQHQHLERLIHEGKSEVNSSLQENHSHSASRSVPNAEAAFSFPCMDLLQQVSSDSAAFAMPSATSGNPTSSSTDLDYMNLDDDVAYYNNQPTERSVHTPSAAFPKPDFTVQPEVLVRTRSLADLNVTPIPNPMPGQVPQDSKLTSEYFELTQTVALRKPLKREEVQMRIDFERNNFLNARHTCSYLRHQSDEDVQHIWRKREASIIMDLVVVPLPEPQPIFGLSYNAGSHRNIKDAYNYTALDF